jgi:tetratricopeptide (TPR) repeat protein
MKDIEKIKSNEEKVCLLDEYAEQLFGAEKYAEVIDLYQKALEFETSQNIIAYLNGQIGMGYYMLYDDNNAETYLTKAHKGFDPQKPQFMKDMFVLVNFYLGSLYEYQSKPDRSLSARLECLKYIDSQDKEMQWMLYSGISRNYEAAGLKEEAIKYYQKAVGIISEGGPGLTYLYERIALNHYELNQYEEALQHFQKILDLDPNFERREEIYLYIAECHRQQTNHRMALESYLKLLDLREITGEKKNVIKVLIEIAYCYFRLKEYENSLVACTRALKEKPQDKKDLAEIHSFLANNYYELQRYQEAIVEGRKSMRISKEFRNVNYLLRSMALSYHKLGDSKNFKKYKEVYQKIFPQDESWNKYLAQLNPPSQMASSN